MRRVKLCCGQLQLKPTRCSVGPMLLSLHQSSPSASGHKRSITALAFAGPLWV